LSSPAGEDPADFLTRRHELAAVVYEVVTERSGSISAEHGVGTTKRDSVERIKSPVELDLLRAVKRAIDPAGLMNPGKVLAES